MNFTNQQEKRQEEKEQQTQTQTQIQPIREIRQYPCQCTEDQCSLDCDFANCNSKNCTIECAFTWACNNFTKDLNFDFKSSYYFIGVEWLKRNNYYMASVNFILSTFEKQKPIDYLEFNNTECRKIANHNSLIIFKYYSIK